MITPKNATAKQARPLFLRSSILVSRPAINIRIITPISAVLVRKSVLATMPRQLGPRTIPAIRAPTTCGR